MSTSPVTGWQADLAPGSLERAAEQLRAAVRSGAPIVLCGHVAPDGDALGSVLALHHGLTALGARSLPATGDDPARVPPALVGLPGYLDPRTVADLPSPERIGLLVALDTASQPRLGTLATLPDRGVPTLVVDHHASGAPFGDVAVVAPRAAATVQLVEALLDRLGVALTPVIATWLYVGLVTDTGRFGFASTDQRVHELAGRLVAAGVDVAELTRRLYASTPLHALKLVGVALARLEQCEPHALAHTHLLPEDLAAHAGGPDGVEGLIDVVRTVDTALIAMVAVPAEDGVWRVSLRSRGGVDVGAVAARFGGGGHAAAAGFTTEAAGYPALLDRVLAVLGEG